jgi:hypothetical protein
MTKLPIWIDAPALVMGIWSLIVHTADERSDIFQSARR